MDFKRFENSWQGMRLERQIHRFVTPLALFVAAVSVVGWTSRDEIVVMYPPTLTEASRISMNSADEAYKRSWALYAAMMMGNATPATVGFLLQNLEMIFTPSVFQVLRESLADQVDRIKTESLSIGFQPEQAFYEPESDRVYVSGMSTIRGPSGDEIKDRRTYEFVIGVNRGIPQVTFFDTYAGNPVFEKKKAAAEKKAEKERREDRVERAKQ